MYDCLLCWAMFSLWSAVLVRVGISWCWLAWPHLLAHVLWLCKCRYNGSDGGLKTSSLACWWWYLTFQCCWRLFRSCGSSGQDVSPGCGLGYGDIVWLAVDISGHFRTPSCCWTLDSGHRCGLGTYLEPADKRPWPLPIFIYPRPEWAWWWARYGTNWPHWTQSAGYWCAVQHLSLHHQGRCKRQEVMWAGWGWADHHCAAC